MKILYIGLICFLSSCAIQVTPKMDYLGANYTPTKEIDIYVDERSIDHQYKIIGKGYPHLDIFTQSIEKLQETAVEKAKKIGANAILIKDYYTPSMGAQANSFYRTDSLGKGTITTGSTTITNDGSMGFIVLFLKYTYQ